jgi:hypothetical protein
MTASGCGWTWALARIQGFDGGLAQAFGAQLMRRGRNRALGRSGDRVPRFAGGGGRPDTTWDGVQLERRST